MTKLLYWVGSSRDDLRHFPRSVRRVIGYVLYLAQVAEGHSDAKPLKGFGGAGVVEIAVDHAGNAYRGVDGMATPKREMELIRARLRVAERFHVGIE